MRLLRTLAAATLATAGLFTTSTPAAAATITAEATTNVWMRTGPATTYPGVYLLQGGQITWVYCWLTGQSVNGDSIWYRVRPNPAPGEPQGYVAGWYLTTGADPNPQVGHC